MIEVGKIVTAIIFTHKFTVWEPFEDLYGTAMLACWGALGRFNPYYFSKTTGKTVTSFNYFSLSAKQCLIYHTIHQRKHRNLHDVDNYQTWMSSNQSAEEAVDSITSSIAEIYHGNKDYNRLSGVLIKYLKECGSFNKRDFSSFCKSYGYKSGKIRSFLQDFCTHQELYEGVATSNSIEVDGIKDIRAQK